MARHGENIRKRKDGRWEARFICGYGEDGRAKYKYVYRKTYAEVKEARKQLMSEKTDNENQDTDPFRNEMNFASLLTDWLHFIRQDVKESTYSRYRLAVEKHICPELGELLVSEISSGDIENFTQKMLRQGNLKKSGSLSPKTVAGFLSIIRLALDYGMKQGYKCRHSVVIRNPRQKLREIRIFTQKEQMDLEETLLKENSTISLGILTSLYLGLRIGEICALRWEDLDLENGLLYVRRSVQRIPDLTFEAATARQAKTRIVIDAPKTDHSFREIPIPFFMLSIFQEHRTDADRYLLTGTHSCMEPRIYYRKYKTILKKCGLERFNYHALRHTFATRCMENEFDVKSLSEILGHANVSTTLQRYVHPPISLKRRHMDRLGIITVCGQKSGQEECTMSEIEGNHVLLT